MVLHVSIYSPQWQSWIHRMQCSHTTKCGPVILYLIFPNIYTRQYTVYPKKYAHGFYFAVLCCGYTLTDFPISIRLTSLALWQSNDCPSASKATLMNMDKYFMWIHYERLHNHNKAKHNKTVCIFLGIYCSAVIRMRYDMPLWVQSLVNVQLPFPSDLSYCNILEHVMPGLNCVVKLWCRNISK